MQKKSDLKGVTGANTSNLAVREDLSSLKARIDKLDVDKLKTVSVDLTSRSNVVGNNVVKSAVYDKLVTKVNTVDTKIPNSRLFSEIQHDSDKQNPEKKIEDVDKKIPNSKNLVNKTAFNTKAPDIENKMPNISNIGTNSKLSAKTSEFKNKVFDIYLAIKAAFNSKATEI